MALTRHLSDEQFDTALRAELAEETAETIETSSSDELATGAFHERILLEDVC